VTAALALARAEAEGLTLTAEGGALRVRGPHLPSPELVAELQRCKQDLLLLLEVRTAAGSMSPGRDDTGQSPDLPVPESVTAQRRCGTSPAAHSPLSTRQSADAVAEREAI
jgi:hypothetical protein